MLTIASYNASTSSIVVTYAPASRLYFMLLILAGVPTNSSVYAAPFVPRSLNSIKVFLILPVLEKLPTVYVPAVILNCSEMRSGSGRLLYTSCIVICAGDCKPYGSLSNDDSIAPISIAFASAPDSGITVLFRFARYGTMSKR